MLVLKIAIKHNHSNGIEMYTSKIKLISAIFCQKKISKKIIFYVIMK